MTTDMDIIAEWLVKHGKTTSEYMLRLKRDGEVFLGPNGFIEPEDISAVNVEDLESEEISLDDIERAAGPFFPVYQNWLDEEIEAGRIQPPSSDIERMSKGGLCGAAAGRKLAESVKNRRWFKPWTWLIFIRFHS